MDMSASFKFTVNELSKDWFIIAPDWRGFGLSDWASEGYWFPDYVADLSGIINAFSPDAHINLVGLNPSVSSKGAITSLFWKFAGNDKRTLQSKSV